MTVAYLRSNVGSMQHKILKMSGCFTVGRAKVQEVSLCLLDVNISRKHCELRYNPVGQNWTVTDYSSNGVTVNGIRCKKYVAFALADGDQIILADQKKMYNWTLQVPLTPITKVTAMKRKVTVIDEDEQEVAEGDTDGDKQEEAGAEEGKEEEDRANLDKFMANQTGEDNDSFTKLHVESEKKLHVESEKKLHVESEKKHGTRNEWMYKDETMYLEMKDQQMALPSMEQQATIPYKSGISVFHKSDKQVDKQREEVEQREALAAGNVGIDGKDLVKPDSPSVNGFNRMSMTPRSDDPPPPPPPKNPQDIVSKVYQRIKISEARQLAAARARVSARAEAAAEKRRESIAKATMSAPSDAVAVEQKRKEYVKNVIIERKKAMWARASVLRKSQSKKLNI